MITHLSYPSDQLHRSRCMYSTICISDGVVDMIANFGRGVFIGKMNVKSEFRLIPIYRVDFDVLCFAVDGLYYIDKCIPIAYSVSCKIWETFATFQQRFTQFMSGLNTLDHFLDDFVFAGRCCIQDYAILMSTFVT